MSKRELIVKLYAASQLLKEVEAGMESHTDIEELWRINIHAAYDTVIAAGHHLLALSAPTTYQQKTGPEWVTGEKGES